MSTQEKRPRVNIEITTAGTRAVRVNAIQIIETVFTAQWLNASQLVTVADARTLADRLVAEAEELYFRASQAEFENTRVALKREFLSNDKTQPGAFEGAATAPVQTTPLRMRRAVPLELQTHGKGGLDLPAVMAEEDRKTAAFREANENAVMSVLRDMAKAPPVEGRDFLVIPELKQ